MTTATKASIDTLCVYTLTLRAEHPDTEKVILNPVAAHGMISRCAGSGLSGPGRPLYWVAPADSDGRANVVVQTGKPVDWSPLSRDLLLERSRVQRLDLGQFEPGVQVRLEVMAAATRTKQALPWTDHGPVADLDRRAGYAKYLGLEPDRIAVLSRVGFTWNWKLTDGTEGSFKEREDKYEQPLIEEADCKSWFMNLFSNVGGVELQSCAITGRRVVPLKRSKPGNTARLKLAVRSYSAVVVIKDAHAFVDLIASGVGRHKSHGLGLVRITQA